MTLSLEDLEFRLNKIYALVEPLGSPGAGTRALKKNSANAGDYSWHPSTDPDGTGGSGSGSLVGVAISALPDATTPLSGAELVPIVQSGTTKKTTTQDIADLGSGGSGGWPIDVDNGTVTVQIDDDGGTGLSIKAFRDSDPTEYNLMEWDFSPSGSTKGDSNNRIRNDWNVLVDNDANLRATNNINLRGEAGINIGSLSDGPIVGQSGGIAGIVAEQTSVNSIESITFGKFGPYYGSGSPLNGTLDLNSENTSTGAYSEVFLDSGSNTGFVASDQFGANHDYEAYHDQFADNSSAWFEFIALGPSTHGAEIDINVNATEGRLSFFADFLSLSGWSPSSAPMVVAPDAKLGTGELSFGWDGVDTVTFKGKTSSGGTIKTATITLT